MRTAYLHIGMPKTGTTALQKSFFRHAAILKENNLWYPTFDGRDDHVFLLALFHPNGADHFFYKNSSISADEAIEQAWKYAEFIKTGVAGFDGDLFLSTEYMHKITPEKVVECKEYFKNIGYNLKVICYVRHPFDQAARDIQQAVKENHGSLSESLLSPKWHRPSASLSSYMKVIGEENVLVGDYEEIGGRGIQNHILQIINFSGGVMDMSVMKANSSLSMAGVIIGDAYNQIENNGNSSSRNREFIFKIGGPKFRLPRKTIELMRVEAMEEVEWIEKHFNISLSYAHKDASDVFCALDSSVAQDLVNLMCDRRDPI